MRDPTCHAVPLAIRSWPLIDGAVEVPVPPDAIESGFVSVNVSAESEVTVAAVKRRLVVVALVMVAVENAKFTQSVLSAERSPPPKRPEPALIVRDDETALMPSENVAVFAS